MPTIRMNGHSIRFPDTKKGRLLHGLVKSKEFQRLRKIQQNSFSDKAFPSATHTRFEHSLGVYEKAVAFCEHVKDRYPEHYNGKDALKLKIRALLHDIGHGPQSHSWEVAMDEIGMEKSHEEWGRDIVLADTEVGKVLEEYGGKKFRQEIAESIAQKKPKTFWDAVISGQVDIDRFDYLIRDASKAGMSVDVDFEYMLKKMRLVEVEGTLCIAFDMAAKDNVAGMLQSRLKIYNRLCHEPSGQGYEFLMKEICSIVRTHLKEGKTPEELDLWHKDPIVKILQRPNSVSVEEYLQATGSHLDTFFDAVMRSSGPLLAQASKYAARIQKEEKLHVINIEDYLHAPSQQDLERLEEFFQGLKDSYPDEFLVRDQFEKEAWKNGGDALTQILFVNKRGNVIPFGELHVTKPVSMKHDYVLTNCAEARAALDEHLRASYT